MTAIIFAIVTTAIISAIVMTAVIIVTITNLEERIWWIEARS